MTPKRKPLPAPIPTPDEVRRKLMTELTVPLWPDAGRALNLSKNPAYKAAANGEIPTVRIGGALRVPSAPLRRMLGLEDHRPQATIPPTTPAPKIMPPKNTPAAVNRRVA